MVKASSPVCSSAVTASLWRVSWAHGALLSPGPTSPAFLQDTEVENVHEAPGLAVSLENLPASGVLC